MSKLFSVPHIKHPSYPGTARITELKAGGPLYIVRWVSGKQRMKQLVPRTTKADLGKTAKQQRQAAWARGLEILHRLATEPEAPEPSKEPEGLTLRNAIREYERVCFIDRPEGYKRDSLRKVRAVAAVVGFDKLIGDIGRADLERYIVSRRGQVRTNTVLSELQQVKTMFNRLQDERHAGAPLLEANPLERIKLSRFLTKDPNQRRPVCSPERFGKLLARAEHLPPAFKPALVTAWGTGRRRSAILALKWEDVDLTSSDDAPHGTILWYRGAVPNKKRRESRVPMNQLVHDTLKAWRKECGGIAKAWVFPSPSDSANPLPGATCDNWLLECEKLAKLSHEDHGGWHTFRRGFATARKDFPISDLQQLGGWANPETLLRCYARPDSETMLQAVEGLRMSPSALRATRS